MDTAEEVVAAFRNVRQVGERSSALLAQLDELEPKVDETARQALAYERACLIFFAHFVRQIQPWEIVVGKTPSGIPTWSEEKRQQFFDAIDALQAQMLESKGQMQAMREKATWPDVRELAATLIASLETLFGIFESHRQAGLQVEADADIAAGRVRKFGSAKAAAAFLSRKIKAE